MGKIFPLSKFSGDTTPHTIYNQMGGGSWMNGTLGKVMQVTLALLVIESIDLFHNPLCF
jgi:hypothetical protein